MREVRHIGLDPRARKATAAVGYRFRCRAARNHRFSSEVSTIGYGAVRTEGREFIGRQIGGSSQPQKSGFAESRRNAVCRWQIDAARNIILALCSAARQSAEACSVAVRGEKRAPKTV